MRSMQAAVSEMGVPQPDGTRAIFCNRTLNLRAIRAIGYDMDYTLIDYDVNQWEGRAYAYGAAAVLLYNLPGVTIVCYLRVTCRVEGAGADGHPGGRAVL